MDENDLKRMFEEFGRVHSINVLRDKATGASKGKKSFLIRFYRPFSFAPSAIENRNSPATLDNTQRTHVPNAAYNSLILRFDSLVRS